LTVFGLLPTRGRSHRKSLSVVVVVVVVVVVEVEVEVVALMRLD
jgi:hypothetical protein